MKVKWFFFLQITFSVLNLLSQLQKLSDAFSAKRKYQKRTKVDIILSQILQFLPSLKNTEFDMD